MKRILILLCLPMIGFGQTTYVPDDNFEAYLEANGMGNGITNDDYVTTANINTVTNLYVVNQNIVDLTGIEDFTALTNLGCYGNQLGTLDVSQNTSLTVLNCDYNQLTTLDVSQNTALTYLFCATNQLTTLDVSQNTALIGLSCGGNQLTTLDVSNNTALTYLSCSYNQLTSLDVSYNTALTELYCNSNQLTSLDVSNNPLLYYFYCNFNQLTTLDIRNGNNANIATSYLTLTNNPQLYCINVDNPVWSSTNWTVSNLNIDSQHYFSNNCSGTAIEEHTTNKELLRTIDILGRETKSQPLFYIYDDGTVEKRIVIE